MKSKIKSGYIVLAVLVIVSVLITIRSCVSAKNSEPVNFDVNIEYNNKSNVKNSSKKYVAALYIEGTIQQANVDYDQNWLLSTLASTSNTVRICSGVVSDEM